MVADNKLCKLFFTKSKIEAIVKFIANKIFLL